MNLGFRSKAKILRPLKNVQFCSGSRKAKILTSPVLSSGPTGQARIHFSILKIALKLYFMPKFEPNAEIGQKGVFFKSLLACWSGFISRICLPD